MGFVRLPPSAISALFELRRRSAKLKRKQVEVGRFTLPYLEGGNPEGPTIVLIHGFSDSKDSFVETCQGLSGAYRLVLPDLPGFSEASSPLDFSYDLPSMTEVVAGFFDALGLYDVHVVGSSLGGAVTVQLAMTRPELVRSMSLVAAAGLRMPTPSQLQLRLDAGDNPFVIDSPAGYDDFVRFVMEKQPPIPAPIRRHLADEFMARSSLNQKIMGDLLEGDLDLTPRLGEVKAESLLIWGDQDRLIDISAGHAYQRGLPNSRMVIFHGIGHIPQYECPARTARYIGRFVESLEG